MPEIAKAAATAGIPFRALPPGTEYAYPAVARIGQGPVVSWQWRSDVVPRLQPVVPGTVVFDPELRGRSDVAHVGLHAESSWLYPERARNDHGPGGSDAGRAEAGYRGPKVTPFDRRLLHQGCDLRLRAFRCFARPFPENRWNGRAVAGAAAHGAGVLISSHAPVNRLRSHRAARTQSRPSPVNRAGPGIRRSSVH